jgi:hypothetical protein
VDVWVLDYGRLPNAVDVWILEYGRLPTALDVWVLEYGRLPNAVDVWILVYEIFSRLQGIFGRSSTPQNLHYSGCMEGACKFIDMHLGFHRWKRSSS